MKSFQLFFCLKPEHFIHTVSYVGPCSKNSEYYFSRYQKCFQYIINWSFARNRFSNVIIYSFQNYHINTTPYLGVVRIVETSTSTGISPIAFVEFFPLQNSITCRPKLLDTPPLSSEKTKSKHCRPVNVRFRYRLPAVCRVTDFHDDFLRIYRHE